MTPHPITVPATTLLAQAATLLVAHDLKRLPVVDAEGRLAGMISRCDLLSIIAERLRQRPDEPLRLPSGAPATAGDLMLHDVPAVNRATPLDASHRHALEGHTAAHGGCRWRSSCS